MARVVGGSGEFAGMEMLGVETLSVGAWRVEDGPLAAEGQLIIELPSVSADVDSEMDSLPDDN